MLQITPPSERQATPLAAAPARMAQSVPMARDTRLDVFRAICLIMIFINHVPGQYLEHLTSKNFGFSDSAEAFVLISGLSAGLAYGRKFVPGKRIATTIKIWRRAFTLYVAHIMTSIITLAIFAGGALYFGRQELVGEINIRPLVDHTEQGIVAMVLLGHQLGYNNILSMYAIVLLVLPGMLLLRNVSSGLLIAVSGALWLSAGLFHIVPANFLDEGYWFLNPFSWQFLFAIGIVCMMRTHQGRPLPRHPLLIGVASAYVLISLFWVAGSLWHFDMSFGLPAVLTGFDKTFLSAPRLLHVLAVAYLCAVLPVISRWARLPIDHPLVRVGRHSLPIFILGTILAMLGQVLMFVTGHDPLWGTLFVMVGIALHFAYARYLDWLSTLTKAVAPVAA